MFSVYFRSYRLEFCLRKVPGNRKKTIKLYKRKRKFSPLEKLENWHFLGFFFQKIDCFLFIHFRFFFSITCTFCKAFGESLVTTKVMRCVLHFSAISKYVARYLSKDVNNFVRREIKKKRLSIIVGNVYDRANLYTHSSYSWIDNFRK